MFLILWGLSVRTRAGRGGKRTEAGENLYFSLSLRRKGIRALPARGKKERKPCSARREGTGRWGRNLAEKGGEGK